MSPTQRTLKALRDQGWVACVVEKWNPYAKIRQDVGGFGDILAWRRDYGVLLAQVTTASNISSRINKVCGLETAYEWVLAGGILQVWGWRKKGERGKRKVWQSRVVNLVSENERLIEVEL